MNTRLSVLAWDDPRATAPLRAAARRFEALEGIPVDVGARSLAEFNDEPIERAAERADLLLLDYPMIPRAAERGALLPIADTAPASASPVAAASFTWADRTWALPMDLACQVAAWNVDALEAPPTDWDSVRELADARPGSVAIALFHSDLVCALLSISAASGWVGPDRLELHVEALETLLSLARAVDPALIDVAPPALLTALAVGGRLAYAPLVFGYARAGRPPSRLRWADAPEGPAGIGSVLGGAGLAVSARTESAAGARAFAAFCASAAVQEHIVPQEGGQPSAAGAWDDPAVDAAAGGFYSGTRRSIAAAVRRPSHPSWPDFSLRAGHLLRDAVADGRSAAAACDALARIARDLDLPLIHRYERTTAS